jgi:3-hydroxyisobutyrate dehydrogenase
VNTNASKPRVGFIGLGIMGRSMAGHLLAAGHPLAVYNRTPERAGPLLAQGAAWCDTPAAVAARSDVVITIVGMPTDVEQVWLGPQGILSAAARDALLIDMTTSSPALARRLADEAQQRGCSALDAPVSGGDIGARDAKLSIMVGGNRAAFERALPVLQCMGTNVVHQGEAGAGQHTKMCNQIVIAGTMMGVCEGLAYGRAAGLDLPTVLQSIGTGAASSFLLTAMAPKIIAGNDAPGFMVEHFAKDLGIALAEADRMHIELPALALARQLYAGLIERGFGRNGTQALIKAYEAQG